MHPVAEVGGVAVGAGRAEAVRVLRVLPAVETGLAVEIKRDVCTDRVLRGGSGATRRLSILGAVVAQGAVGASRVKQIYAHRADVLAAPTACGAGQAYRVCLWLTRSQ